MQSESGMNDLNKALGDIGSIRRQVAQSTEFRGYGPATLAGTGALAIAAAGAQALWLPDQVNHMPAYLSIWIWTAVFSAALIGTEMHARTRRVHSGMADAMIRMAVEQFLPSAGAGALVTVVLVRCVPAAVWDASRTLADHLQPGRVLVVPLSSARHGCGGSVVLADGSGLALAGRQPGAFSMGHGHSVWSGADAGGGDSVVCRAGGQG
jgi:hypothetical protein